ncbi:MAG: hypothetical protein ACE5E3_05510, partial [Mariprofundus sp.]
CAKKVTFTEKRPYRISAGIGYGQLLVTGGHGEFFGPEMNLASKLGEDTAQGNQLFLTETAFDSLPEERKQMFRRGCEIISGNEIHFHALYMEDRNGLITCCA